QMTLVGAEVEGRSMMPRTLGTGGPVTGTVTSIFFGNAATVPAEQPMGWFFLQGSGQQQWGWPEEAAGRALLDLPHELEVGRHEVSLRVGIKVDDYNMARRTMWTSPAADDKELR